MTGEANLSAMLANMKPVLNKGEYVFAVIADAGLISGKEVLGYFQEKEGLTVIVSKIYADEKSLAYSFIASWITLTVHSSLEAAGLTAAFSTALAKENISCNVVAAFYHDHLFVPAKDAKKAMEALEKLAAQKQ